MSRTEFDITTLFEFNCRLKGWQEQQDRRERQDIENTRMLAQAMWMTVSWKKKRIPNVKDVFPMPWDPKPVVITQSEWDIAVKVYKTRKAFGKHVKVNSDRQAAFEKYLPQ